MAKEMFERKVDKSIVAMTDEEKEEIRNRLEAAKAELIDENFFNQKNALKNSKTVTSSGKPSVIRLIWNFIRSLLFSVPFKKNSNISIGRLKEIKGRLDGLGIQFFDFKKEAITADFALYMLDVYKGVKKVHDIFINPSKDQMNEFYCNTFFEGLLSSQSKNALHELSREKIEMLFHDPEIKNTRDEFKKKQEVFVDTLKENDMNNIKEAIQPLDHLLNIFDKIDFVGLFTVFGYFTNGQLDINLRRVDPKKVLPFLKDIGSVVKLITEENLHEKSVDAIVFANSKVAEKNINEKPFSFPIEIVNKSLLMMRKLIKFEIIDSLIQYTTMDEMALSGYTKGSKIILNKFLNNLLNESTRIFNQIDDEKAKEFLVKSILNFFRLEKEDQLISPGFYTMANKKYLERVGVKTMDFVKPISIVLTFLKEHYEKFLRYVINTLVVKGSFVKKMEGEDFSAAYYRLDDNIEKLHSFVAEELNPREETKNVVAELIRSKKELSNVEKKTIKAKFSRYDAEIEEIIEKIIENLFQIFSYLMKVQTDLKKRYPEFVSNAKHLKSKSGGSFQTSLEEAIEIIDEFMNIIRNYVIIKSEIANAFKQLESNMES